jgi:hypothetical protein
VPKRKQMELPRRARLDDQTLEPGQESQDLLVLVPQFGEVGHHFGPG